ncbi:hypothetical protein GIB67_008402 [Kingdonia uniflora]|uniref:Sec39 domain-containing protein n=1 Tax=Kingdonia uniflora TaxID=39325 RepID=A0A7J7N583_9MAGN|nr:hypothetical protein GIB67_008402 [Kingdonia uniflora]
MVEENPVSEVLFETRYHAKRPFCPNYPPQQSRDFTLNAVLPILVIRIYGYFVVMLKFEQEEGVNGGLLSLLSVRGLTQLKEKWSDYKRPIKLKKLTSLFVSSRGEHIAVAVGNVITVLQKDDDYKEPCGIFTGNDRLSTFKYGAWSDSHNILGVIDDNDTLYFIKANGEEITRKSKKQLKVYCTIIGLVVPSARFAKTSCLCQFSILTSDGSLHNIEVGQESIPSFSSMPTSNNLRKQFPQNVLCMGYHPEYSLVFIVGSSDSVSEKSNDNAGFYCLSLWHVSQNLHLEPVSYSSQFEGLFSLPKGYVGPLATPKVVISPQCKHAAVLDLTGFLDVFNVDGERHLFSLVSFSESSQVAHSSSSERRRYLSDVTDITWWSDSILVISKRSGVITMVDVLSGREVLENDILFSSSILERVPDCQGHIFILESTAEGSQGVQDKPSWSLVSFLEKSVSEMYTILISNQQYEAARDFAIHHGLEKDEIFKSQWLQSCQGTNEINMFLPSIKDQVFVLSECVDKVGKTEDSAKALLACGLRVTDRYKFFELDDDECSQIWDFRIIRLQLLQFKDRLETFVGINMGRFSMQEYSRFRILPLNETAITLAESGKIGTLNLLFKRHPYSLAPFMLDILASIPETVPVQIYGQLLPGRSPPTTIALRENDWVECENMVNYLNRLSKDQCNMRTEAIIKHSVGFVWPSVDELTFWYTNRVKDIDILGGQLESCLCMLEFASRKGIVELKPLQVSISYLHQLIFSDGADEEIDITMNLVAWEELSDYDKFKMMLDRVKEDKVVERLRDRAIPFMLNHSHDTVPSTQSDSFLVRWLKEVASVNKLDIFLAVIEEGCRDSIIGEFFGDEDEAVECVVTCVYLCTLTDRWNTIASILSKLPRNKDNDMYAERRENKVKIAEGHVEAGRLLAYYQVPKPMGFFLEAHTDEKGVKQILRLILSKFGRRQPVRSDNDWANMWRDMQLFQEKAFPFLDIEYMLMEFCRGLLKAGKFSLARNYLKGTGVVSLGTEKAENLVIQSAREYFFSASSLACTEIWRAKECLNLFPSSKNVKAEADIIDALTIKLPSLGVTLLPMQFRQIRDPMEIINMVITSQTGAYLNVDEIIEIAKLLGLSSQDEISAVEEAVAREAAVAGDLQLAFDLCLVLSRKGHGSIWDLCAAIAKGPILDNMNATSRKQLLGFSLSHCDEESIGELLYAWKNLDMQSQCESLVISTGTNPPDLDIAGLTDCSEMIGEGNSDQEFHIRNAKTILSTIAKDVSIETGMDWDYLLKENRKLLTFAALQLPWLFDLSRKAEYAKRTISGSSVRTQALLTILSWLACNDISPSDELIASLVKSKMEESATKEDDILGFSFLLNLVDAFHGVEIIEEQLKEREGYSEVCSIMNMGMAYSTLHNCGTEYGNPGKRRELLLQKFKEKHSPLSSDAMDKNDKIQSTFWREWKSKLQEQKLLTYQSRILEQTIPGVDTSRFFSGDHDYIENMIFSLSDSVKLEKRPSLKEVLKLATTYGLNHNEVLLRYIASTLVSDIWTNDDIEAEISDYEEELSSYAATVIGTISLNVYPAIDGCNKQRLAYIFSILSECYLKLKGTEYPPPVIKLEPSHLHSLELPQFYKILEQECGRVSFIKNLNFKNITELGGLNLQSFNDEVYNHVDDFSVEPLAKMVQNLRDIYTEPFTIGLISLQDVYKHYILSLLTSLVDKSSTTHLLDPEKFQGFVDQLEENYDCLGSYIRLLSPEDVLDVVKQYYASSVPHDISSATLPGESAWVDCLISILKFWIKLSDDMQVILSEKLQFSLECLSKYLNVFISLIEDEKISPIQGWDTVLNYVRHGLSGFPIENLSLCRSMIFSACRLEAITEVFSDAMARNVDKIQNLPDLYVSALDPVLLDMANESSDHQNLHNLLSTLNKCEGSLEDLKMVRCAVWGRLSTFSDNMQLKSHVRVYVLELMQSITGKYLKCLPAKLISNVEPWEGWDELDAIETVDKTVSNQADASSKFTSTLVALKSTRLASVISPSMEVLPSDLVSLESAISCFLNLFANANTVPHLDALEAILAEWEGLFTIGKNDAGANDDEDVDEVSDTGSNWNNDEWDEGWENFHEEHSAVEKGQEKKEKKDECVISVHPFHSCWMEIIKKLVNLSQWNDVLKLIDRSFSKPSIYLLAENEVQTLFQHLVGKDCFAALKIVLLLPYKSVQLQCLDAFEANLKEQGPTASVNKDSDLLTLFLSSGAVYTIATESAYKNTFSYLCYLVGSFARQCQENQLSKLKYRTEENCFFIYFRRTLFPCIISELVNAKQIVLAAFFVSRVMHTNASFSLVNIAEASLSRYLQGHIHVLQKEEDPSFVKMPVYMYMGNTVSRLRNNLGSLVQSALSSISDNVNVN